MSRVMSLLVGVSFGCLPIAAADIAVVVEHEWTIDNNYFSAFAYDPVYEEFRTGGYSSNQTIRWSHILDDTVQPWVMEGDVVLNWFQLGIFARDGYASHSGSFSLWGMNFNPLDQKYFLTGIGILKPSSGAQRLDSERDLIIFDDRLPDSLLELPTGTTLSNVSGIYRLIDESETFGGQPRAAFLSSGVQPGDCITLFPVDIWAEVLSGTYVVTEVVSETEIRLDRDPCWSPDTTTTGVGYLLSIQPHLTLATFREKIPLYAEDHTKGPKAHYKGGLSLDGQTLYLGDIISENIIAVNTQQKEDFTLFVTTDQFVDYVAEQVAAGRHMAYIRPVFIYTDELHSDWSDQSEDVTLGFDTTEPIWAGDNALSVTYTTADGEVAFQSEFPPDETLMADWFEQLTFAVHGGSTGGQQINVYAYDTEGLTGNAIPLDTPLAQEWTAVEIPVADLGVETIGGFVWANAVDGAQPEFFIDQIQLLYTDPPPGELGDFDPNSAGPAAAQIAVSTDGRVFFSEDATDDIMWTTDGQTLDPFLTSNEIAAVTHGYSNYSTASTGVQVMGLELDQMGTVYWSDNRTRSIWKAPACGGQENIRCLASKDDLKSALGLAGSPRGLNCFTIRAAELLTFNFVEGNFIFKVDLNTFDYGDFDEDIDVDVDDLNLFASVMQGPDTAEPPPGQDELFMWADLDLDDDADIQDIAKLQRYATGPLSVNE